MHVINKPTKDSRRGSCASPRSFFKNMKHDCSILGKLINLKDDEVPSLTQMGAFVLFTFAINSIIPLMNFASEVIPTLRSKSLKS